jgi:hypothetical protein
MTTPLAFRTNPNKDFVRGTYDRQIIAAWCQRVGKPLQYLGLPGPEMLDIIEWQDFLGKFSTIERRENEQHLLFLQANVKDVEHRLHSLYGDFDKILLTGRDTYKHAPRWPYDVINLDFFGGFLYSDMARPRALKKMIDNQDEYRHSFLLIITHDLRHGDLGEKLSYFDDLQRELERDFGQEQAISAFIDWYKSPGNPDAARQALYMNMFLRDYGEIAHFRVGCRPAILYTGTGGTKMIHFVTEFDHQKSEHRAVSDQSLREVLNLGLHELKDGQFTTPATMPILPSFFELDTRQKE